MQLDRFTRQAYALGMNFNHQLVSRLDRRQMLRRLGALSLASLATYSMPSAQANIGRPLIWIDIDLPIARAVFNRISNAITLDGTLAQTNYLIESVFLKKNGALSRGEMADAVAPLLTRQSAAFVCMSHHTAEIIRASGSAASMVLVSVLDPVDLGLMTTGQNGSTLAMTFDNIDSFLAVELMKEISPNSKTLVVVAAREWCSPHRMATLRNNAAALQLEISIMVGDTWSELLASGFDHEFDSTVLWWVPESIVLFDNRRLMVEVMRKHRRLNVFGRRKSAEMGALFATDSDFTNWEEQLADLVRVALLTDFSARVPLVYPDDVLLSVNVSTLQELNLSLPEHVASRIDQFV